MHFTKVCYLQYALYLVLWWQWDKNTLFTCKMTFRDIKVFKVFILTLESHKRSKSLERRVVYAHRLNDILVHG